MIPIVVVSTAFNAERYAYRCVASVRNQEEACHHIYVNDASTDGTVDQVLKAAELVPRNPATKFSLIARDKPRSMIQNLIDIIHSLAPETIVVSLDGDDWLWSADALSHVREAHAAGAWVTFGQFIHATGEPGWAAPYDLSRPFRQQPWTATHLKTYRAGLFQQIRISDFLVPAYWEEGQFIGDPIYPNDTKAWIQYAVDIAVMMPLLEMAGERHEFIPKVLMCYQNNNPTSRALTGEREAELAEARRILAMKPYERLERAPW